MKVVAPRCLETRRTIFDPVVFADGLCPSASMLTYGSKELYAGYVILAWWRVFDDG